VSVVRREKTIGEHPESDPRDFPDARILSGVLVSERMEGFGARLRALRHERGLSQKRLAEMAGVSRQLVGAVEAGRHLPRVDAALALARALQVDLGALLAEAGAPVDVITGIPPAEGSLIKLGRVGDRVVSVPAQSDVEGWNLPDGVVVGGRVEASRGIRPGLVVAGCEPALGALEEILRDAGYGALAVAASTGRALEALTHRRSHAAVVHGADGAVPPAPDSVVRFRLVGWRIGLGVPEGLGRGWFDRVRTGRLPVVQRDPSAAIQQSFVEVVGPVPGPVAGGHLEAARVGRLLGMPALTIEPAARATGLEFFPLGYHVAELWVEEAYIGSPEVGAALAALASRRFRSLLGSLGGYELSGLGERL
jgi:transcriptional regulator with XRE-family HTH domain